MSDREERVRKQRARDDRQRKKTLRLRHQQFILEDTARHLSRRESDRLVKEKASEQRLWDEVKALRKRQKATQVIEFVYSDEDSEEDSEADSEADSEEDSVEDTDWNSCFTLSYLVVLFFVSNLLVIQFVVTRRD
jgi:hypothetical protein